jgi:hypothetical protein
LTMMNPEDALADVAAVTASDLTLLSSKRAVYVGGLADSVTPSLLRAAMIPFGDILSVDIVRPSPPSAPSSNKERKTERQSLVLVLLAIRWCVIVSVFRRSSVVFDFGPFLVGIFLSRLTCLTSGPPYLSSRALSSPFETITQ